MPQQNSNWSVAEKRPNDDWIYDMRFDLHKQSQFLITYHLARTPTCQLCQSVCSARLLVSTRQLARNRLPYRWVCNNLDCNGSCTF